MLADDEGIEATVLCLSSPERLNRDWRACVRAPLQGAAVVGPWHLMCLLHPGEPPLLLVTVIDGASHVLAFLSSALGTRCVPLDVDKFGQAGSQPDVHAEYEIDAGAIVTAALAVLTEPTAS